MCIKSHKIDQRSKEINSASDPRNCYVECLSDHIRARAYHLLEDRGHQPGRELDDWLQAERETKRHWGIQ
jgi:hypothetical protein